MIIRTDTGAVEAWNETSRLTDGERGYCLERRRSDEYVAARVLLKSLVLAALEAPGDPRDEAVWRALEVEHDDLGKPELTMSPPLRPLARERGWERIHVSISHTTSRVSALLVVETDRTRSDGTT